MSFEQEKSKLLLLFILKNLFLVHLYGVLCAGNCMSVTTIWHVHHRGTAEARSLAPSERLSLSTYLTEGASVEHSHLLFQLFGDIEGCSIQRHHGLDISVLNLLFALLLILWEELLQVCYYWDLSLFQKTHLLITSVALLKHGLVHTLVHLRRDTGCRPTENHTLLADFVCPAVIHILDLVE